jgi:cytochrome c-type biogenesis protein CcmH/NrfG
MFSIRHRILSGILTPAMILALSAGSLTLLTACGLDTQDVLTWSNDAKRQGFQDYNDGKYAEAAGAFRNAIRQNPQDPESQYWLGMCYEQTESWHEAIDAYKTSLRLMPPANTVHYSISMHDSAFDRLARIVAEHDATGSETDLIAQSISQATPDSDDYRLLGRIFRFRGDADSALDNYRKAVHIDPDNFAAQRELGLYLEQLTQNQEAAQVLREAYRLNQRDDQVNAALRNIGVEPGPNLLAQEQPVARPYPPSIPAADPGLPTPASNSEMPSPDAPAPRD